MALTTEQLSKRHLSLGASDMAAVCGVSPYKSAADVWSDKVFGRKPPDQRLEDYAEWGDLLEPAIREWYRRRLPPGSVITVPKDSAVHPERQWATATPDGVVLVNDQRHGLEIKNRGKDDKPRWVDGVPCDVAAQCQWGMYVTGFDRWDVVALTNGNTPFVHRLDRDDELIGWMLVVGELVWSAVQAGKDNPPDMTWVEHEMGLIRERLVSEADQAAFRKAEYWRKREAKGK